MGQGDRAAGLHEDASTTWPGGPPLSLVYTASKAMLRESSIPILLCLLGAVACGSSEPVATTTVSEEFLQYEPTDTAANGRHIVLISGDEEYRSEEGLPMLARMLSTLHGFRCTVLFAVDPDTGIVNPHVIDNIPGTGSLDDADLMVIQTRWRDLPDDQMEPIDRFLMAGKPVIALRTATHAFKPKPEVHRQIRAYLRNVSRADDPQSVPLPDIAPDAWSAYDHYGDGYTGPKEAWRGGFGRLVVGERWVAHHGRHKHESARGVIAEEAADHPILRGVDPDGIWSAADVYTVRLPLPGDSSPLVYGKVMARAGEYDEGDSRYGMRPTDDEPIEGKNDPMMPVVWTKTYQLPGGVQGRVLSTTLGSSTDLLESGVRQLLMNSVFWALDEEGAVTADGVGAELVGEFNPTKFNNHPPEYWIERAAKPADFR